MKKYLIGIILLLAVVSNAQPKSDRGAISVLDKASGKINKESYSLNIKLSTKLPDKKSSVDSQMLLRLSGNKFYIKTADFEIFFDGKTQWTYYPDINEVTISIPTAKELEEISPFAIIKNYKNKYRIVFEQNLDTKQAYAIALLPNDKKQEVFRIRFLVNKTTYTIEQIESSMRNGQNIVFRMGQYEKITPNSDTFRFNTNNYPKVSINDLR